MDTFNLNRFVIAQAEDSPQAFDIAQVIANKRAIRGFRYTHSHSYRNRPYAKPHGNLPLPDSIVLKPICDRSSEQRMGTAGRVTGWLA